MTLIVSATGWLVALLLLSETYFPLLLSWRAAALRQTTGDSRYQAEMSKAEPLTRRLARNIRLAVHILTSELVIAVLGGYLVLLYVLLFTFLSGFDYIFRATYSLESWQTGVCFGSIAAGATAFTLLAPGFYALARHRTEHVRGAPVDPEFRLWPSMVAGPLLPVALFWLGWTNRPSVSIWSGLAACFLFGAILIAIYVSAYEYIVDSYGNHAAIALAAVTGLRYVIASGMVVAARPMYESLGVRWTMTFLGCFAVLLAPAPWLFWMYGTRLRHKSPYAMGASRVS